MEERKRRVPRNISLTPSHDQALTYLMREEREEVRARIVQSLIDQEMRRRIGRDWPDVLRSERAA